MSRTSRCFTKILSEPTTIFFLHFLVCCFFTLTHKCSSGYITKLVKKQGQKSVQYSHSTMSRVIFALTHHHHQTILKIISATHHTHHPPTNRINLKKNSVRYTYTLYNILIYIHFHTHFFYHTFPFASFSSSFYLCQKNT